MSQTVGIKKGTTINLIRDILKSEMQIPDERIFFYNEDYVLPDDNGLWIIVAFSGSKPYSNRNSTFLDVKTLDINGNPTFMEKQNISVQELITVHMMSYNLDALERMYEVPQALVSLYAQNSQTDATFKIAPIMNVVDASEQEGGRINYRFDWRVTVLSWQEKIKPAQYYNTFKTQLTVSDGAPTNMTENFDPSVKPK